MFILFVTFLVFLNSMSFVHKNTKRPVRFLYISDFLTNYDNAIARRDRDVGDFRSTCLMQSLLQRILRNTVRAGHAGC